MKAVKTIKKRLADVDKKLTQVESLIDGQKANLAAGEKRIKLLFRSAYEQMESLESILADSKMSYAESLKLSTDYENQINELREELRIANDVTIPGLVKSHELKDQIYNTDISAQVRRQVGPLQVERIE